ncbi:octaprenyl diphosphate synthase [Dongshaea marina]|uniref:octaprenyl diphosphate synthase n=1 Tax=Dongshaea marina TaxID=2047966 RepID=UPI000D3ED1BC|nr:octaprenyl diphosphate synthase [Dongshaea marina]
MDLNAITRLSADDMAGVNQTILERLSSEVALINQLGYYIINSGGKRIRPLLTVLAARSLNCQKNHHTQLAAIIEFIHTATLLHDDVVDESSMRRGKETANALFGNAASVLVGDFLYSRAFEMMTEIGNMEVMRILSSATNVIAEGEVMQLMNCNDPDLDEASYMEVIYCKTARLFEAACELAAVIEDHPAQLRDALRDYGRYLGTAFQIIDDVMDYTSDPKDMGKNVGDDLAEGKVTLPLIYAMAQTDAATRQLIRSAIEKGNGMEHLATISQTLEQTGALEQAKLKAQSEAQKAVAALEPLPASEYKDALIALAELSVARSS